MQVNVSDKQVLSVKFISTSDLRAPELQREREILTIGFSYKIEALTSSSPKISVVNISLALLIYTAVTFVQHTWYSIRKRSAALFALYFSSTTPTPTAHPYPTNNSHLQPQPPPPVLSRMQLTPHATHRTPRGASSLVHAMSAWPVKTRCAPSRQCKAARVYGHTNDYGYA